MRRPCFCRQRRLASATARRVVRSEPDTPSRPASNAPYRHRSARGSDRPTPRSSPRTGPPAAAAAHAPAPRHQPPPARRPAARPSCDHTPPTPPRVAANPSSHTPQESPSLPPVSSSGRPPGRALTTTRAGLPTPQDRTVGRNRGHPCGETMAASGEIPWPPMGSFPWPPSVPTVPVSARLQASNRSGSMSAAPRRCHSVIALSEMLAIQFTPPASHACAGGRRSRQPVR